MLTIDFSMNVRYPVRLLLALLLVGAGIGEVARPAFAMPSVQTNPGADSFAGQHLYLLPAEPTSVSVEVHIAELRVGSSGAGSYVNVDALYRLRNDDRTAASLLLRLAPSEGSAGAARLGHIRELAVTSADQPVGLQETENGNYTFRVQVGADGRLTLRVRYQVDLGTGPLATVRYPLDALNGWPGEISIRVEVRAPDAIASDSWTRVEPDGWNYGLATDPGRVDVKWLYDRRAPSTPIIFQFVNAALWQQIRTLEMSTANGGTGEQYRRLGQLYQQLYDAAGNRPVLRDRFFAQTVAAYTAGFNTSDSSDADRGAMHYGLAQVYRQQAAVAPALQANEYAGLMVNEVAAALDLLEPDDARRLEMGRWRADGLTLLLNEARAQENWDRALSIVDELATLPEGSVSETFLADERDHLLVQKALQLLEQGDRAAAFAVAGPQLAGAQLEPPEQMQSLFTRWALTVTATPTRLEVMALGLTAPERHADALRSAQDMVNLFTAGTSRRSSEVRAFVTDTTWEDAQAVIIQIALPSATDARFLANLTPATVDWVLLRTLFGQLSVNVAEQNGLLWRQVNLSQALDLRPVSTQWASMANSLERQAQEFETAAIQARESGQHQTALASRIRAVHYRSAAERWRALTAQSWLLFELRVERELAPVGATLTQGDNSEIATGSEDENTTAPVAAGGGLAGSANGSLSRAWYAAVSGPSQVFTLQAQLLNVVRLITVLVFGFGSVLAMAGLLWWLL